MIQTNDPSGTDARGFGASIGSNDADNSSSKSSAAGSQAKTEARAKDETPARSRSAGTSRKSKKTSRVRSRSGESPAGASESSGARAPELTEAPAAGKEQDRPRRRRSRGSRKKDQSPTQELQTDSDEPQRPPSEKPSRKRTRGGRGRSRKKPSGNEAAESRAPEPQTPEQESAEGSEESQTKNRRRRGSRGGRGRTKKVVGRREKPGAAVVEVIPGEEDDLPELVDLPDEAELLNEQDLDAPRRSKKKRSRRQPAEGEAAETRRASPKAAQITPDRKILVNACDQEETRVAVVRAGKILDFQMNVVSDTSLVNDIYRGRVVNIEHSIGAAFIDFGRGRNGFLHTSDVLPTYADGSLSLSKLLATSVDPEDWDASSSQPGVSVELDADDDDESAEEEDQESSDGDNEKPGRRQRGAAKGKRKGAADKGRKKHFRSRPRSPIDQLFKVGQKVVVQITKDAIGDKGPTLTTYLSIPGRYLVLMPSISHSGVSRKIEDAKERKRLKRILDGLKVPEGMGVIARTATMGHTKIEIKRDLDYLLSAWNQLSKRLDKGSGPTALYQESDVAIRTVRDLFGPETEAVIVDEPEAYKSIREFAEMLMPEHADRIVEHDGKRPLFHAEGVEQDFEKIFSRRIELPSGGSIVFDQAEALVAIDVNSGKTRTASHDFEEIALKTNMEAVPEIARQIRLRDLGGIVVVDFIDMMKNSNRKAVEQTFRSHFSDDRARSKVGRISQFGLLEMTRQRLGPGMSRKLFKPCTACRGAGRQRTESSRAAAILRRLGSALCLKGFTTVEIKAHPETIEYLKQNRAGELNALEQSSGRKLEFKSSPEQQEDSVLRYLRTDGREVRPGGRRKR